MFETWPTGLRPGSFASLVLARGDPSLSPEWITSCGKLPFQAGAAGPFRSRDKTMENSDLKPYLGHLTSSVGHLVINAFSTIVSQGEILRTLNGSAQRQSLEVEERIETVIRTALDASLITRRLIELSHAWSSVDVDQPGSPVLEIRLDQLISDLVSARKPSWGPRRAGSSTWPRSRRFVGRWNPFWPCFDRLFSNAVESLPGGEGTITISTADGVRATGWQSRSATTVAECTRMSWNTRSSRSTPQSQTTWALAWRSPGESGGGIAVRCLSTASPAQAQPCDSPPPHWRAYDPFATEEKRPGACATSDLHSSISPGSKLPGRPVLPQDSLPRTMLCRCAGEQHFYLGASTWSRVEENLALRRFDQLTADGKSQAVALDARVLVT